MTVRTSVIRLLPDGQKNAHACCPRVGARLDTGDIVTTATKFWALATPIPGVEMVPLKCPWCGADNEVIWK